MTLTELAERTGEDAATLHRFIELGVLADRDEYTPADVERIGLVQLLRRRGIEPQAVGVALQRQLDVFDRYLAQIYPDEDYSSLTLDEAALQTGVDLGFAQRVRDAGGLGTPSELLTAADLDAMRALALATSAGVPEEALLQLVRVCADALNRVGETEARLFHFYVHERLRAEGLTDQALQAATTHSIDQLIGLLDPTVRYFHRRGLARAVRDDLALHLAEEAGLLPPDDETGRIVAAVCFIDLARFTALTEAMGDATAADILDRFSDLVRRSVANRDGRIVKQIGDAFMLVFGDPRSAVECALDIRAAAAAEDQFLGTRQGIHWGPVLYREGDYYGGTVNLAARIVAEAAADRILVSAQLQGQLSDDADLVFVHGGHRTVKHVAEPIEVYDVHRAGDDRGQDRTVDPVCGMIVDPDSSAARLQFDGRTVMFCSQACLQRFVANPDRYT
jgi:class 3 adenylate cyclase/YHS domain-containing protein